jgi:hypothetical protein
VTDSRVLFDALERIADGGCVIDAAVAAVLAYLQAWQPG